MAPSELSKMPQALSVTFEFEQGGSGYRCDVQANDRFDVYRLGRAVEKIGNGSLKKDPTRGFVVSHSDGIDGPMVYKIEALINGRQA